MCGPTRQETTAQAQEQQFSNTLQQNFQTVFGEQQDILNNLNNVLSPIAEAGPNQQGYSPEELAALNTQALDTTGANYANAARATNSQLAGRGDSTVESGVQQQIQASLASKAAGQTSAEELGITQGNYAEGRANWQTALAGENQIAGLENPNPYAGETTNANKTAFGEADTIAQQEAQESADIAGGITGVAGMALGGVGNLDFTGGSSPLEQFANFAGGM